MSRYVIQGEVYAREEKLRCVGDEDVLKKRPAAERADGGE